MRAAIVSGLLAFAFDGLATSRGDTEVSGTAVASGCNGR
jgi:hypothetical protein